MTFDAQTHAHTAEAMSATMSDVAQVHALLAINANLDRIATALEQQANRC